MEKFNELKEWNARNKGDMPTLGDWLDVLLNARKFIIGLTLAIMVLGFGAALYLNKYRSDGFLQFGGPIPWKQEKDKDPLSVYPGIVLSDYKRFSASFNTAERFEDFVQQNKLEEVAGVSALRRQFKSRDGIVKLVEPVYTFTKLDAKELMDQPKDAVNNIIGLRINYGASTPQEAQQMVGLLGRYAMDSIIYMIYSDNLRFKHIDLHTKITQLDNDIILTKERLEEYSRKGETLKRLAAHYPDGATQASQQVVTITEENSRYLSPATLLKSTEVQALTESENIIRFKREQKKYVLLSEYYDKAKELLASNKLGETVIRGLEPIKESVFKTKDMSDETVKEVYNLISIENQSSNSVYLEKTRFIAGPNLPEHRSIKMSVIMMLSLLIGLFVSSSLALLHNWRLTNRKDTV